MSLNYNFIWLLCYLLVLVGLAGYGFHRLSIVYLYWKNRNNKPQPKARFQELPVVTVQLPMFNEKFVVDRLLESVAALDYPQDKLEIQILDDSTDDTTEQCYRKVEELKSRGFDAVCIHRTDRTGFKAGALEAATKVAKGEFLLILDADFVPEPDLLQKTIHFFTDENVGLVQTRWGHINREYNLLTRIQGMYLDGHFAMEQTARNRSGRFFTFNGTAGIWRKCVIGDAGGWSHDTLTEDMDLSYRVQLRGWRFIYLNDVVTPAELPVDMDGFKSQQHRWTKGSIQVCQKILLDIWRSNAPLKAKVEATTHLTCNYSYLLLALLCFLVYPICTQRIPENETVFMWFVNVALFFMTSVAVCIFYMSAQIVVRPKSWWKELPYLPLLLTLSVGMAVNNAKAVLEECRAELTAEGVKMGQNIEVGTMIETPAAVFIADELAAECDFFSIGTNDLTQYTCALDRQNAKLEPFFNPHHPAVLRAIKMTIEAGHRHGIWVGICGELGADTALTETFLRMGVDELSMNAKSILPVRKIIRSVDLSKPSEKA